MIEQTKKSTAPEKLDAALKKLESSKEIFSNPLFQFLLMAAIVFIIGFIVQSFHPSIYAEAKNVGLIINF